MTAQIKSIPTRESIHKRLAHEVYLIGWHAHGGFYGDGNSNYWVDDEYIDLDTGKYIHHHNETWHGQLAGPSQHSHREENTWTVRDIVPLTTEEQEQIANILDPLIETAHKYPHRCEFSFFSAKHRHFFTGRVNKARKIAEHSDFFGIDCLQNVWILPELGIAIKIYLGQGYKEKDRWTIHLIGLDNDDTEHELEQIAIVDQWSWLVDNGREYTAGELADLIREKAADDSWMTRSDLNYLDANSDAVLPVTPLTHEQLTQVHLTNSKGEIVR